MKRPYTYLWAAQALVAAVAFPLTEAGAQEPTNPAGSNIRVVTGNVLSSPELTLSLMVLLLGIAVAGLECFLIVKSRDYRAEDALKYMTITLIVIGTLILVSAGLNNTQIAGATGLFGSMVGYLLGRNHGGRHEKDKEPQ
jgi:hypothetical protein